MSLAITINKELDVPLHTQLTAALRDAINLGRLASGQALPSTRELAQLLNISRVTVVRSYNDLASQGLIEIASRGYTFVSRHLQREQLDKQKKPIRSQLNDNAVSDFANRLLHIKADSVFSQDFPNFSHGAGPIDLLPVKQWQQLLVRHSTLLKHKNRSLFGSSLSLAPISFDDYIADTLSQEQLRIHIANYLRRAKAVKLNDEQVLIFPEYRSAYDLIARLLVNVGDPVIVEDPGHSLVSDICLSYGAKVQAVSVDEDGLIVTQLSKLTERCKLMYVTPSHQDPTGAVMSLPRRKALLDWAAKHCDFIIEDSWDSDYYYASSPMPAVQSLDNADKVIYIYSFQKLLFPLLAATCLVVPPSLLEIFTRAKQYTNCYFSMIECRALTDFVSKGDLNRHLRRTQAIYKRRRQALIYALGQNFQDTVSYFKESAGLHMTVRFDLPLSNDDIVKCAKAVGLPLISTLNWYRLKPVVREFIVSFALIPEDQTANLVALFAHAIKSY